MNFNFDTKNTFVLKSFKLSSFPLFKYAGPLSQLFFCLLIVFTLGYFLGIVSLEVIILNLLLFILLIEIYLFTELKIKNIKTSFNLSQAILETEKFNLAEFLSLESCKIIESTIRVCKKSLFKVSSEALFYSALIESKKVQTLIFRLGLNPEKLKADLKNYLEKSREQNGDNFKDSKEPKSNKFELSFSESFQNIILESAKISVQMGHENIGEKEILISLAKHDDFFKKVLVEAELKDKDVENICFWLDFLDKKIEKNKKFWTRENLSKFGSLGKDFASGFTFTLDKFSFDWRDFVKKNIFEEIIGHEKEIDQLEIALSKSNLKNVLIIGEEGVGKKSMIQALAQRCFLGTGINELDDKRVVELDMVSLISRIQDQEKLESTLDDIFNEVLLSGNVILVIDNINNFVTVKVDKPGEIDISVILSKYLNLPDFHFVAITSFEGLHRKLEQVPSFLEYFRKVEVGEVSEMETIRILQNMSLVLEQKHKILILYPSIREIINLTNRYLPAVLHPKKDIDVLEEAVSYIKSIKVEKGGKTPSSINKIVNPSHIAKIISDKTQIPIGKLDFKEKSVLMNLESLIHQKIINQESAIEEISIAMRRARSGLSSKKRPIGVFLFLGPTGVGKTETAKALAEIYFGGVSRMIRLDMSEFQAISDIPRLIGSISPVEQQGLLTTPVRENPFSLVLLDEIEKAHPNILNLFLQVFDEGHVTDGQGRKVIFTNTIIISTSNAGAPKIFKAVSEGKKLDKDSILDDLFERGIFKPEFINRFDATVIFHPLTKDNLINISKLMLSDLAKSLKDKDIEFIITDNLKQKVVDLSYKPEFGAREMRRVIQNKIENKVAQALLSDKTTKGDKIEINPDNFEIVVIK